MRIAAVAVLALAAAPLRAQESDKVALEWKLAKGESVRYQLEQTMSGDFGAMKFEQDMIFGQVLEATDVSEDGVATIKVSYDRIKFKMTGPMETDYDSDGDKEAEGALAKLMAAMVGKSFTMKMNRKGEVLEVKGYEKMVEEAKKSLSDEDQLPPGADAGFTDETMKKMMQQGFAPLPGKPVAKGDAWDSSAEMPMGMAKLTMKTKSALKELREGGKEAVIAQEIKGSSDEDEGGMMNVKEAKGNAEVIWSLEKGRMLSRSGSMTMTMEAGGQEITMETKTTMKLAPREKKEKPEKKEKGKDKEK